LNRIKQLRNELNIKQDVLAKFLNLEIAGISKLETGRVPLKDEYILKLADFFNVSTDYLLGKSTVRNLSDLNSDNQLFDISGLDEENIREVQNYIKYIKWKMHEVQWTSCIYSISAYSNKYFYTILIQLIATYKNTP